MHKVTLTTICLCLGISLAAGDEFETRFGQVSIDDNHILTYNDKQFSPPIIGNFGFSLIDQFEIGDKDILLFQNPGGSACPIEYFFITISAKSTEISPTFGTCSEVKTVKQYGNSIIITMPGFLGPFAPARAREKAYSKDHAFVYNNGQIFKDGKPI